MFGAGGAGTALIRRLLDEPDGTYQPVAVLDDDPAKRRLRVHGIPVLGDRTKMAEVAAATGATVLVIAIARASGVIRDLTARAEQCGLTPKVIPTTTELISGGARIEGVRDPRISDLLGRRAVQTDVRAIAGQFTGKRILVTGAGGSIGSELCRQLYQFGPAELIMLDRDESALHEIQLTLHGRALLDSDETVLADIRDAAPGPRGLPAVPAADRLPRGRAQAPAAAGALPGRGGAEQRPRHPDGAARPRPPRRRVVREHLHRQGREPGQRARLLQEDRGAADRAHGGPGRRHLPERPLRQRPGQPRLGPRRAVGPGAGGRPADRDPPRGHPLLHDRGRGGAAGAAGGGHRRQRRGADPRHGRAGPDRGHRPPAGGPVGPTRWTSSTPACGRARSWPRTCSAQARRTTGRAIR